MPSHQPRTPGATNLARQVTHTVDMFEHDEPWVNVPGFAIPQPLVEGMRQVWAPVRKFGMYQMPRSIPLKTAMFEKQPTNQAVESLDNP